MPTDTQRTDRPDQPANCFDQAPGDCILFGGAGGPSPADAFIPGAMMRRAIRCAWAEGQPTEALRLTQELLAQDDALTAQDTAMTLACIDA